MLNGGPRVGASSCHTRVMGLHSVKVSMCLKHPFASCCRLIELNPAAQIHEKFNRPLQIGINSFQSGVLVVLFGVKKVY